MSHQSAKINSTCFSRRNSADASSPASTPADARAAPPPGTGLSAPPGARGIAEWGGQYLSVCALALETGLAGDVPGLAGLGPGLVLGALVVVGVGGGGVEGEGVGLVGVVGALGVGLGVLLAELVAVGGGGFEFGSARTELAAAADGRLHCYLVGQVALLVLGLVAELGVAGLVGVVGAGVGGCGEVGLVVEAVGGLDEVGVVVVLRQLVGALLDAFVLHVVGLVVVVVRGLALEGDVRLGAAVHACVSSNLPQVHISQTQRLLDCSASFGRFWAEELLPTVCMLQ